MWSLQLGNATGGDEWKFEEKPVADLEVAVRCMSVSLDGQRLVMGGGNETFFSFKDMGVVLVWNLLMDSQVRYPMRFLALLVEMQLPDTACATVAIEHILYNAVFAY